MKPALWGCAAIASLLAVAVVAQTGAGQSRLAAAYGSITGSTQLAALEQERRTTQRERELESETRRLTEAMRNLSEDRDQLLTRMAAIERNYEDVTGSIGRLANPSASKPSTEELFPIASSTELAPVIMPPQPGTPVATIPAAPAQDDAATTADGVETTSARTDFGVDLGGGSSLAAMRAAWRQVRRNHGTLLNGLRPVIGIRDGKGGQVDLRLVVGPITNAAAAAKLCASLAAAGLSCQPAMFDGQRLALR